MSSGPKQPEEKVDQKHEIKQEKRKKVILFQVSLIAHAYQEIYVKSILVGSMNCLLIAEIIYFAADSDPNSTQLYNRYSVYKWS